MRAVFVRAWTVLAVVVGGPAVLAAGALAGTLTFDATYRAPLADADPATIAEETALVMRFESAQAVSGVDDLRRRQRVIHELAWRALGGTLPAADVDAVLRRVNDDGDLPHAIPASAVAGFVALIAAAVLVIIAYRTGLWIVTGRARFADALAVPDVQR